MAAIGKRAGMVAGMATGATEAKRRAAGGQLLAADAEVGVGLEARGAQVVATTSRTSLDWA